LPAFLAVFFAAAARFTGLAGFAGAGFVALPFGFLPPSTTASLAALTGGPS